MNVCKSCYYALDEEGAFEQYDAEGDSAGLYDTAGGGNPDTLAADCGGDLPEHECEGGFCPCSGHTLARVSGLSPAEISS